MKHPLNTWKSEFYQNVRFTMIAKSIILSQP